MVEPTTTQQAVTWLVRSSDTNGNAAIGAHDVLMSPRARALMARADSDRSGILSAAELTHFAGSFAGGDGRFTKAEYRRMESTLPAPVAAAPARPAPRPPAGPATIAAAVTWLVRRADTNGNAAIGAHDAKLSPFARALMARADTDRSGILSGAELSRFARGFAGADRRIDQVEFQRMVRSLDGAAPRAGAPAAPGPAPRPAAPPAPGTPAGSLPIAGIPQTRPITATRADGYRLSTMPTLGSGGGQADQRGNLYVSSGREVRVFNDRNQLTSRIPLPFEAHDVAPSPDGSVLYVTRKAADGTYPPQRMVRAADGSYRHDATFRLEPFMFGGKLQHAEGMRITTDGAGNLYVADGTWTKNSLNTVAKFSPDGTFLTRFGDFVDGNREDASSWEQGRFYWALGGIAVSPDGSQVFTTEIGNNRVQRWDVQPDGSYVSAAMWGATQQTDPNRTGSSEPGRFAAPYDIGLDAAGGVYVMNTTASQIQKFTTDGTFVTSMFVGANGPDAAGPGRAHGIAVTARGDAVSIETGRMMERAR